MLIPYCYVDEQMSDNRILQYSFILRKVKQVLYLEIPVFSLSSATRRAMESAVCGVHSFGESSGLLMGAPIQGFGRFLRQTETPFPD